MKDDPWDLEHLDISDYSKEELESYIRHLETENAVLREDKEALDWLDQNAETVFFKFKSDNFRLNIRETFKRARAREAKPDA
jgi:hypothetical protein